MNFNSTQVRVEFSTGKMEVRISMIKNAKCETDKCALVCLIRIPKIDNRREAML